MTQANISTQPAQDIKPIEISQEDLTAIVRPTQQRQYGRITESDIVGPREGVFATARDRAGMVAQTITDDSIINYQGVEMTVGRAVKAGLLRQDGQGGYQEVPQAELAAHQAQEDQRKVDSIADQVAPAVDLADIDPEAPEILDNLLTSVQTHGYSIEQIAAELVSKREAFHAKTLPDISRKTGMSVQEISDQLNRAGEAVVTQIKATVEPYGVDTDAFIDWMDTQGSRGAAAYAQAFQGNFLSVKNMVQRFKETNAQGRSTSDRVHVTPSGRRVVTIQLPNGQSMQVSEATAIRMHLI